MHKRWVVAFFATAPCAGALQAGGVSKGSVLRGGEAKQSARTADAQPLGYAYVEPAAAVFDGCIPCAVPTVEARCCHEAAAFATGYAVAAQPLVAQQPVIVAAPQQQLAVPMMPVAVMPVQAAEAAPPAAPAQPSRPAPGVDFEVPENGASAEAWVAAWPGEIVPNIAESPDVFPVGEPVGGAGGSVFDAPVAPAAVDAVATAEDRVTTMEPAAEVFMDQNVTAAAADDSVPAAGAEVFPSPVLNDSLGMDSTKALSDYVGASTSSPELNESLAIDSAKAEALDSGVEAITGENISGESMNISIFDGMPKTSAEIDKDEAALAPLPPVNESVGVIEVPMSTVTQADEALDDAAAIVEAEAERAFSHDGVSHGDPPMPNYTGGPIPTPTDRQLDDQTAGNVAKLLASVLASPGLAIAEAAAEFGARQIRHGAVDAALATHFPRTVNGADNSSLSSYSQCTLCSAQFLASTEGACKELLATGSVAQLTPPGCDHCSGRFWDMCELAAEHAAQQQLARNAEAQDVHVPTAAS